MLFVTLMLHWYRQTDQLTLSRLELLLQKCIIHSVDREVVFDETMRPQLSGQKFPLHFAGILKL